MSTVIGIDAGGTATRCLLLDHTGQCLGIGRAGPGNPISAGSDIALRSLGEAIRQALLGLPDELPELILVTMAGMPILEGSGFLDELRRRIGIDIPAQMEPDLLSSYFSGRAQPNGYLLIAGTGAVAGRVTDGRLAQISDGLGWLIGDEGSGFWIGREAVLAVVRAMDGRGPRTSLTAQLGREIGWTPPGRGRTWSVGALLENIYRQHRPVELSRFARLVIESPEDPVARGILERAAASLLVSWRSVSYGHAPAATVLAGGVLRRSALLRERIRAEIGETVLVGDGLIGSGLLALRSLGCDVNESLRSRIEVTLSGLPAAGI